ncbi:asparagine synthetase B family protein [Methanocalculus sp. MC3]
MSRIAGLYISKLYDESESIIKMMLNASSFHDWIISYRLSNPVAIGWTGWSSPGLNSYDDIIIALDGFIYNWEELGGNSATDNDMIKSLYLSYGFEGTLQKINGDFTITLYDAPNRNLWIGRDRFGIKPLYYSMRDGKFAFASRLRALLTLPWISRDINKNFVALYAVSHYRTFDNDSGSSPYVDISQLPAAHFLQLDSHGIISCKKYWNLKDLPDFDEPEEILAQKYKDLLIDSVSMRFKIAQMPAFSLSGGMDSSSVLASAVHYSQRKQVAFSTTYEDKSFDESDDIQSIIETSVEKWNAIKIDTPDVFSLVSTLIDIHDEPVATATWLSHYLMCLEVKKRGYRSIFGGLGGDELNAGEYEHFMYFFADLRAEGLYDRLKKEVEMWIQYHDHPIFHKSINIMEDEFNRLIDFSHQGHCLPDRRRIEKYNQALNEEYYDLSTFEPVMDHPFTSYLKNRTYQDLTRETIPCCLRSEDRNSVSCNLNHFLPFFDHRLVEFMFRIPVTMKYRDGVTKFLMRQAMKGILAEETRNRVKKTGWNAPGHIWFVGEGAEKLRKIVRSEEFCNRGIYYVPEVLRLIDEHERIVLNNEKRDNHMMFLWQLLNLHLWLEKNAYEV